MIRFKACPKCGGDLSLSEDIFGRFWNCLQCGLTRDIPEQPRVQRVPEAAPEELRRAA
jgi:ssDNA-binding Zn-finger/Zn-ribbon topoisomerase 1